MASIYHLAGTILGSGLRISGRFSSGKTIPDSIIIGIINNIPETNNATDCDGETADMNKPKTKASKRYISDTIVILTQPLDSGTSSRK
jgi:hypothetical protein